MGTFKITTPLSGEHFIAVRLAVGGICALAGFDVDTTEDFKVCVTESLLILKRNGYLNAEVEFEFGETLICRLHGIGASGECADGPEDEISRALLSALIGEVDFVKADDGRLTGIVFEG